MTLCNAHVLIDRFAFDLTAGLPHLDSNVVDDRTLKSFVSELVNEPLSPDSVKCFFQVNEGDEVAGSGSHWDF